MDPFWLILTSILILLLAHTIPKLYDMWVFTKKFNKIPGPPYVPYVGPVLSLIKLSHEDRLKWLIDLSKKYHGGIFKIWMGSMALVRVHKPEYLEAILPSTTHISKSRFYDFIRPWLGTGLLTSTGEKWFHDRKLITPAFHFSILEQYSVTMFEKAEVLAEVLEKAVKNKPGQPIDIFTYAIRVTLDIICETAMGLNMHVQEDGSGEKPVEYAKNLQLFTQHLVDRFLQPWSAVQIFYNYTEAGKTSMKRIKAMHDFTEEVIRTRKLVRKQQKAEGLKEEEEDDIGKRKRRAFLDLLLDYNEKADNPLTDAEIREQVDTVMFAGHDTTAAAISWALFCIGNDPEVQAKVHEELDEVFGDSLEKPTLKQISELKYLERVAKEALRLYPSAPEFSRRVYTDVKIGDYLIPSGTIVVLSPYFTHRDPDTWKNPEKFDPDRFLPENTKNRNPYAYFPFSAGPRNCTGQKFAQLEEKIILAAILRRFKVTSVEKPDTISYYFALILRPSNGVHLYFTPRK